MEEEKINQTFLNQLMELGFPLDKSIESLRITRNSSVDAAIEYLLIKDPARETKPKGQDEELVKFLEELQLSKYLPTFEKEEVDFATLCMLSDPEQLLERLGIPLGPRSKIKEQLKKLAPKKRFNFFSFIKRGSSPISSPTGSNKVNSSFIGKKPERNSVNPVINPPHTVF